MDRILRTPLKPHQAEAVAWIRAQEEERSHGGLLAYDCGLGKTLIMIAWTVYDYGMRSGEPGPTLVVCKAALVAVWLDEIRRHVGDWMLEHVVVYHGPDRRRRCQDPRRLHDAVFVITTYDVLAWDAEDDPLPVAFRRIVLDEAHTIKNYRTKTFQAVMALRGRLAGGDVRCWALTGTPIANSEDEVFPYVQLVLGPRAVQSVQQWRRAVRRHARAYNAAVAGMGVSLANSRLQVINTALDRIMLRRTKTEVPDLGLPHKTDAVLYTSLHQADRAFYDALRRYTEERVRLLRDRLHRAGQQHGRWLASRLGMRALSLTLRLRQACEAPRTLARTMRQRLLRPSTDHDGECVGCLDAVARHSLLPCRHAYCDACVRVSGRCMQCFQRATGIEALPDADADTDTDDNPDADAGPSTKAAVARDLAEAWVRTGHKVIIVSQWLEALAEVEAALPVPCYKVTGQTRVSDRAGVIAAFRESPTTHVLLLSMCTAEGVTVVHPDRRIDRMIMLGPQYNSARVRQMSDRIHRIGQRFDVLVVHVLARGTIDRQIEKLVQKKDALCDVLLDTALARNTDIRACALSVKRRMPRIEMLLRLSEPVDETDASRDEPGRPVFHDLRDVLEM